MRERGRLSSKPNSIGCHSTFDADCWCAVTQGYPRCSRRHAADPPLPCPTGAPVLASWPGHDPGLTADPLLTIWGQDGHRRSLTQVRRRMQAGCGRGGANAVAALCCCTTSPSPGRHPSFVCCRCGLLAARSFGAQGQSDAQGPLPLCPCACRMNGYGLIWTWTVAEIGSGVAWIVVPNWSVTNVLE